MHSGLETASRRSAKRLRLRQLIQLGTSIPCRIQTKRLRSEQASDASDPTAFALFLQVSTNINGSIIYLPRLNYPTHNVKQELDACWDRMWCWQGDTAFGVNFS